MNDAIKTVYETRSAIVHGGRRRRSRPAGQTLKDFDAKELALDSLRQVLKILIQRPEFLDPARIDRDLLMIPPTSIPS